MATVYAEIKSIYESYLRVDDLKWEGKSNFKSLTGESKELQRLKELERIVESRGETNPYLNALYEMYLKEAENDSEIDSFDELQKDAESLNAEDSEDVELGRNEETFDNKYPTVDKQEILKKVYVEWLGAMLNKPFFKTIALFYDQAKQNQLNFVDRAFLWKFLKAISSCITHLLIEGEQKEESIVLVDTYFDSLNDCLLSTIHAKSKDDVIQSFMYMVSFLGLNRDVDDTNSDESGEDAPKKGEKDTIGEF